MPRGLNDKPRFAKKAIPVSGGEDSNWKTKPLEDPPHTSESHPPVQSPSPPSTPNKQRHKRSHPNAFKYPVMKPNDLFKQSKPQAQPPWKKKMTKLDPMKECSCPDLDPTSPHRLRTVLELVLVIIRSAPSAYKPGVLGGTRKPTQWDAAIMLTADELDNIVYVPHMVEQLFGPIMAILKEILLDFTKPAHVAFVTRVHPYMTLHDAPHVTNSEHDTQDVVNRQLVRAALAVFNVVRRWLQSNKQGDPIQLEHDDPSTFAASGAGSKADSEGDSSSRKPIPDICVIHLEDTFITGEVKTKNVVGLGEKNPLAPAQMVHDRTGSERGMKFIPPRSVSDTTGKMARILIQLWGQMVDGENDFAFLSSIDMTTPVLLAMVSWLMVAIAPELVGPNFELQVPDPESTKEWRKDRIYGPDLKVGIATSDLPKENSIAPSEDTRYVGHQVMML